LARRSFLWFLSLAALVAAYALVARAVSRPDFLPPPPDIAQAFFALLGSGPAAAASAAQHPYSSAQVDTLVQEGVTLQASLLITTARVLFGLAVGLPLGILMGLLMGFSRRADEYLHPLYVLLRSVPPLALITYIMLWLGHSEAHRLIPIVYAVAVTAVIPTYHGVRDVAGKYVVAARSLGAKGRLLLTRVVIPAAAAEMLMAENGMGNLLVGGGMWSSRLQTRSDPAVIIIGILALAAAGWVMDLATRAFTARLTRWSR
jgi:ABC-type nitrate/sulfonate/bicarbonate transport system permease component